METSTPCSAGSTRQTLPLPSTRRPPSPTISAVRSSMPSPPRDEPGLDGGDQARQHAALGHVHLDGHVDEADAGLDLELVARLRRGPQVRRPRRRCASRLRASLPPRSSRRPRRRGRAHRRRPAGAARRTPARARRARPRRRRRPPRCRRRRRSHASPIGSPGRPAVRCTSIAVPLPASARSSPSAAAFSSASGCSEITAMRGRARPAAPRSQRRFGDERRVKRGIRTRGRAAADEVHAHAAPSASSTGGSADHGNTIQSSVRR